jgi:hypothetical protein
MNASEFRVSSPAWLAATVALASVAAFHPGSPLVAEKDTVVVVTEWPAPDSDVPFIDGVTITASRT